MTRRSDINVSGSGSKKAPNRLSLVLRIALFACACIFSVVGVMGFIDASNTQTTSQVVTMGSVRGQSVCHALVLFSYDESDANVAYERDGVLDVLNRGSVSYDTFYLDARSSAGDVRAEQRVTEQVTQKAQLAGGYDAIITAGDDALSYVIEHQSLFAGIPCTFFAVDDAGLAARAQEGGIASGYLEEGAANRSFQAAAQLVPAAQNAVVLVDGSLEANGMLQQLEASSDASAAVSQSVWDVSAFSREQLAERLSALETGSFVFLLAANHDAGGNVYTPSATAHFLAQSTAVPVFSALGGVGEGVCGAAFIDRETQGADAAMLAVDFLNGQDISETPVQTVNPACCVYDAQALAEHGLDESAIPAGATLVNESAFSWNVLRPLVRPLVFLLVAVLCIIAFGVIGFRRSMKSNQEIIASRNDLQYRLYHDLLTELPNRHTLEQFAADSARSAQMASVMQIDIDDFTDINDSYGHSFGNEIIKLVAKRLSGVKSLLLVRSGGDEFTLAFKRRLTADSDELDQIAHAFDKPFIIDDNRIELAAWVGIANREQGMTSEDMVVYADLAIHHAKDTHARHPVFYSASMRESMERKLEITAYLRQAISNESVNVLWQPQVDTESLEVYGYEVLCRIEGNAYYPNDFIPVAEMSGLIAPLDRIVTKKTIAQLGAWLKEGRDVGVASINFSAAQLRDKGYCDFLAGLLDEYGVPGPNIKIEITESMILDNEDAADQLFERLHEMGVTLALDDFGTGYSSLYRMAHTPADFVKLDRSLVSAYMTAGNEGFIEHITELVHGLDKKIIVEGVETYEQYEICLRLGCDIIQGYFFSTPISADEAIDFDPNSKVAEARVAAGDKTRNADWRKYSRDAHGRWVKKESA